MKKQRYHNPTSFIDLLFNCLVGFVYLFVISFLLIAPPVDDQKKKPKAEFLITLTWDSVSNDDVDLWIQSPIDEICFFREKEKTMVHLDRDDIGTRYDNIVINGLELVQNVNQEIATIRGFIPGEWIVNIHMYAKRWVEDATVNVRIDKLNPKFQKILDKNYTMKVKGEEYTVARMTMTARGDIINQNDMYTSIVSKRLEEENAGTPVIGDPR